MVYKYSLFVMIFQVKKVIHFLADHYILIGTCAVFFYLSGFVLIRETYTGGFTHISLVFWSTLAVYHLIANNEIHNIYIKGHTMVFSSKTYTSLILAGISGLHFFFIPLVEVLYLGHLAIITMLYNMPKTINMKWIPLRGIPLLKVFLIAYVWASLGAVFPVVQTEIDILRPLVIKVFFADFFYILAIALPFDIRDYYREHIDEPRTLAHLLGLRHTVSAALMFLGIFVYFIWPLLNAPAFFIPFTALTAVLIFYSTPHKNKYYYTVLLDGTMVLYYFVLRLATC